MNTPKCKPEAQAEPAPEHEIQDDDTLELEDALDFEAAHRTVRADELAEAPSIESLQRQLADKEAEVGELKDQLLRTLAEAENVRRRAERDRQDAAKYAAAPFARDLLAVADNLARAIESLKQEAGQDDKLASLLAGVELTQKDLQSAFERHNISKVDPLGERLDPHRHEAMFEVPHDSEPSGTVVQVVEPGYLLHDRLLRPARVGVAKASPQAKPADGESADDDAGDEPKLKSSA